jgi:hypothetical protein
MVDSIIPYHSAVLEDWKRRYNQKPLSQNWERGDLSPLGRCKHRSLRLPRREEIREGIADLDCTEGATASEAGERAGGEGLR